MNTKNYDSERDTKRHMENVTHFMSMAILNLERRRKNHDASKLQSPEKEMFDKYTPLLKELTYGSKEYKKALQEMGVGLKHHYENNSHHPEHFDVGIDGMSLLDLLEMYCDWQAASLRHTGGSFVQSLAINKERFGMSDQLFAIFLNTTRELY